MIPALIILVLLGLGLGIGYVQLQRKGLDRWLLPYIAQAPRRRLAARDEPVHLLLCIADHYEPMLGGAGPNQASARVEQWVRHYPRLFGEFRDSDGRPPRHTFFYPLEDYEPAYLDALAGLCRLGYGEVEVHLHHDHDTAEGLRKKLLDFKQQLVQRHGLLSRYPGQEDSAYGFIHGNWALDNSRPDGRWCGLNDEIRLLRDLGCYADFTMPSGDSPTQARLVNTIYYCNGDPNRPKSYDDGVPLTPGGDVDGDLLMISGPIGMRWRDRWLPRLETGELRYGNVATPYRVRRWVELAPRIGTDSFIKLFTHGAQERNSSALLRDVLESVFNLLVEEADRRGCSIQFVSAWQMYLAIEAIRQRRDPVVATRTDKIDRAGVGTGIH
jgi:hypothetical protein